MCRGQQRGSTETSIEKITLSEVSNTYYLGSSLAKESAIMVNSITPTGKAKYKVAKNILDFMNLMCFDWSE